MRNILQNYENFLIVHRQLNKNTISSFLRDIKQFLGFTKEKKLHLKKIKLKDLRYFLFFLKSKNLLSTTIAHKISSLRSFFYFLNKKYNIKNEAQFLKLPKIEKKLPHYLKESEIKKIIKFIELDNSDLGQRNKILIYLLYTTGSRASEIKNLKINDINLENNFILINGKGGIQRIICITPNISYELNEYINKIWPKINKKSLSFLFPSSYKNTAISRQGLFKIINEISKKIKIKFSAHTFRHSFATHLLNRGVNLRYIQQMLGHSSINNTQIYTHLDVRNLRENYNKYHSRAF